MADKITKDNSLGEVLRKHPKTLLVFMDYGLNCAGCPLSQSETIKEAAEAHQLDLAKLLEDLNKIA
jgi:hydroxylamine reductase